MPISVDANKFQFSEEARSEVRQEFGMSDRRVVLYLGKFNGLYYSPKEVAEFCKLLHDKDPNFFFFTITPDSLEEIEGIYKAAGIPEDSFLVHGKVPYQTVEKYISAADWGLVAIPPLPSQRYRTPVKVGNYLCCGLPYIITSGIADDDTLAIEEGVGAVFESLKSEDFEEGWKQIEEISSIDTETLRLKCRTIGNRERGIDRATEVLDQILTS
ncbi:MAG: hypothetical protein AAF740_02410 [Bacteroidota bacterium]